MPQESGLLLADDWNQETFAFRVVKKFEQVDWESLGGYFRFDRLGIPTNLWEWGGG